MNASVTTSSAPVPVGHYPHARRAGGLLFLSGIGPRSPLGEPIPEGIEAQCRAVFANVRAVLEAAGSSWEQLIDVTVFLTDIPRDFATFNRLWAEYFPTDPPCRTTVEVTRLPTPIAIELKCIATVED
jgi:2-aminomuconate deaminase